ncbi:hypothetical protein DFJ68_2289 [Terracoccus luteus]|uniref:DUF559 domain-containing protein n=1 Tax=Terracoccus luteus TaxID=53356 RepID=A0A495Y0A2_9MICO|nr:hypothetical protein DFJ68_2289 [Terracoccus luteus]
MSQRHGPPADDPWDDTDSPSVGRAPTLEPAVRDRFLAIGATIPGRYAFSHATAALLLGWPLPWPAEVTGDVHVITPTRDNRVRRRGVVGHRGLELRRVVEVEGVPVVAAGHTWADLGELSVSGGTFALHSLVAAADQALNQGCTRSELDGILAGRGAARGVRNLRPALRWARRGSESAGETQFRLVMHRAGLPLPSLNKNVFDADGRWLFRPDMSWRARRVAVEYQGAVWHDFPEAVKADHARFDRAETHGWAMFAVRSAHVWSKPERDEALTEIAEAVGFPPDRLDLDAAEPRRFSAAYADTLMENLERRRRRHLAQWAASRSW